MMDDCRPRLSRRGLHDDQGILWSPKHEQGFGLFFRPVAADLNLKIYEESVKDGPLSFSLDAGESSSSRNYEYQPIAISPGAYRRNEDWVLYSVWSGLVDEFLAGLQGRRIGMERKTFIDTLIPHVKEMFFNFPITQFDQNLMILIVCDFGKHDGKETYEVEVSEISFRMLDTKSEGKTRSKFKLRCYGKLAGIFHSTVKKTDILVVRGGIPIDGGEDVVYFDVNNDLVWRQSTIILRLIAAGNLGSNAVCLGEKIEPMWTLKEDAELCESRFSFEYVLNVHGGSIRLTRIRGCRPPIGKQARSSVLDKYLFPITANSSLMNIVDALVFYDMYKDASWPQQYSPGKVRRGPQRVVRKATKGSLRGHISHLHLPRSLSRVILETLRSPLFWLILIAVLCVTGFTIYLGVFLP